MDRAGRHVTGQFHDAMHKRLFSTLLALLFGAALPRAAEAQIYHWRDGSGNLVLSDKPRDPAAQTFTVAGAESFRTTRPTSGRSGAYDSLIEEHAHAQGVSVDLVRAVIQAESAYNPRATSHKGAMGLMQLMPATASDYGVADAYDPAENIRAGVTHLKNLLVRYSDNVELALAAYNAGPGAVAKYGTVPPYRETRNYVDKIRSAVDDAPVPRNRIYRTVEYVNGRPVPKYSGVPAPGAEVVTSASRR